MKAVGLITEGFTLSLAGLGAALAAGHSAFARRPSRSAALCAEKAFGEPWGRRPVRKDDRT